MDTAPHQPIIPPLPDTHRQRLVTALADLRRLHTDLQYAALAGLPVQPDLDRCAQMIGRLQRLHQAYFSAPRY